MTDLKLALDIEANVDGQPSIESLQDTVAALRSEIQALQQANETGGKDWLDYAQQATGAAESLANVVSVSEDILIKTAEIRVAIAVYRKWQALVEGVRGAYAGLQAIIAASSDAMATTASAGFDALSANMLKLETRIGSMVARFNAMEALAKGLGLVGLALTVAEIGIAAHQSNEQTRALTEQIGGLSASLQTLDPASQSVKNAKERFEELYKAALALHQETPDLVGQFKDFFDTTASGNLTVQQSGRLLTDFLQIQKSLHATTAETEAAQISLNEVFDSGLTSIPKLGAIFGASLNPALSAVAKSMGITRQQLEQLINTGQLGAETVLPALAAAARTVTAPLQSTGDAADFSKAQFDAMGLSAYDLADKALPGVNVALQYTAKEIANTADASVDPIGAAVERIENFGSRIAEWARLTKQSIADAFAGPDIKQALDTGLKEAMFGLDFLLVGIKEEFVAVGESIGVVAGAAATATNPIDDLKAIWSGMAGDLLNTRDRLNEYVNALEGADNAQGRTADGARNLSEQLKTLPEIKLPEALQDIVDKLSATQSASEAVGAAWKELGALDFTSGNLRNLLVLRQTIQEVSERTQDATGTQAAFSAELSKLPVDKLSQLLGKITELGPRLQQAGDGGALLNTVLGAAFAKLGLNAAEAGGKITLAGKDAAATFALIAGSAETSGAQIRAALAGALDAAKTKADIALISAEFKKLAESGQASGQLVADGQAAILRRLTELQERLPGIAAAFKDLGIASSQNLRDLAESARASFEQLKAGGATLQELQQGFLSWAAAEIEAANAAGKPIPALLRQQAAAMGLGTAYGELLVRYRELKPEQDAQVAIADRNAQAAHGYTGALQALANAQLSGLRSEIDLAKAKGYTWEAQRKSVELAKLEAQWAQAIAVAKQAEIAAEIAGTEAKITALKARSDYSQAIQEEISALTLKLAALGQENAAIEIGKQVAAERQRQLELSAGTEQKHSASVRENSSAQKDNAQATAKARQEATLMADVAFNAATSLAKQSEGVRALIGELLGLSGGYTSAKVLGTQWSGELGNLNLRLEQTNQAIKHNKELVSVLPDGFEKTANAVNEATKQYLQQEIAAVSLRDELKRLSEQTGGNADALANLAVEAQQAKGDMTLLNKERLDQLQQAIDAANNKLRAMQSEAQTAQDRLKELDAQLAAERGDTAKADRIKLQLEKTQALAEVEAKLAEARAAQNVELIRLYEEQETKLSQLYNLKAKNLEQDIKDKANQSTTTKTAPSAPGGGVTINLNAGNARLLDKSFVEDLSRQLKPEFDRLTRLNA